MHSTSLNGSSATVRMVLHLQNDCDNSSTQHFSRQWVFVSLLHTSPDRCEYALKLTFFGPMHYLQDVSISEMKTALGYIVWSLLGKWCRLDSMYFCRTFRNRGFIDPCSSFPICIVSYLLGEVTLTDLYSGEKKLFLNTFKQMEMFSVPFFHFLTHKNFSLFFDWKPHFWRRNVHFIF